MKFRIVRRSLSVFWPGADRCVLRCGPGDEEMVLQVGRDEFHAVSEPAREKADNLVFLNIQKLDSLRTRRGEERTDFWDRALRGFGVRVYPTGRKAFTVRYTLHGELRRRSLGVYRNARGVVDGEVNYSEARAEAERIITSAVAR